VVVDRGDDTWSWVVYTLHVAAQDDTGDAKLAEEAAAYALLLLDTLEAVGLTEVTGPVGNSLRVEEVRA
jgi:hypothetical protein